MSTFMKKLQVRLERERDVPVPLRVRDGAIAAVRYLSHATAAKLTLRDCSRVGAWARTAGGSPVIDNQGRIVLGDHVLLTSSFSPVQLTTAPTGEIVIGDGTVINFGTSICARKRVQIGKYASFGPYCIVADDALQHGPREALAAEPIVIGDNVWLAGRVTVLPGARIGDGSVITAGSIVSGEIPPGVIAGGIPARVLRKIAEATPSVPENTNGAPRKRSASAPTLTAVGSDDPRASDPRSFERTTGVRPLSRPPTPTQRALIIADFTADELADELRETSERPILGVNVAPFGQVVPSLLALAAEASPPELAVVWTRPEVSVPSFQRVLAFEQVDRATLLAEVDGFARLVADALARVRCGVVPTWTLPAYNRGWGLMDAREGGATRALTAMNLRLMERLGELPNVHVVNAQRWVEAAGKSGQHPKLWYMGKVAFHREVFAEAARDAKAAFAAVTGAARKLVVVDLDDTLWGGIVGDQGWENLRLGGHDAVGEAFVDFQRALKNLKRRGIVLAIASKNEESVALEAIRKHPEMVLREDDFVAFRINWNDKARNVAELAHELKLGLQSVVFIDDNPVERARVREALPEVLVPEWPEDKLLYTSALLSLRCFDTPTLTQEDAARTEMYVAERKRASLAPQVGSLEEWLVSLGVRVRARRLDRTNLARATQLFNKTNQLNLSTRRLTEPELARWAAEPGHEVWVIDVSDKCGDSGLTGLVGIEVRGDTVHIVDFLLSCRVMGRKVEEVLVHLAVARARRRGLASVVAQYVPTSKNKPCLDFWKRSGFEEGEGQRFVWSASGPYPCPSVITLDVAEE